MSPDLAGFHILILTNSYPRHSGDFAGSFVWTLAEEMRHNGHEIRVISPDDSAVPSHNSNDSVEAIRFRYFFPRRLQTLAYGGAISYGDNRHRFSIMQAPLFMASAILSTLWAIKRHKPQILNSHWILPQGLVGAICSKMTGIPHVATLHSSEVTIIRGIPFRRPIMDFILNNTDFLISVSRHRLTELMTYPSRSVTVRFREKTRIVPMGVRLSSARIESEYSHMASRIKEDGGFVIVFVGRLTEVKGCEYLIRSMTSLPDGCHLFVIGEGPLHNSLHELASSLHVRQRITFTGVMGREEVFDMYERADVVVIPSIVDSSGYEEGLPVVLEEAMSFGRAIVATRTNGSLELVSDRENGLLVEEKSPSQIAKAITAIMADRNLRDKIASEAGKNAKRLSIENTAKEYESVINELVKY